MQKRKTGIALLLIMALLIVPVTSALAEETVKIKDVTANGKASDPLRTTTYLTITLSKAVGIKDLKQAVITLTGLNNVGNPVAGNIEMGERGFNKEGTEITIPIKMREEVKGIHVKIEIDGNEILPEVDNDSEITAVYYEADATIKEEVEASDFSLCIENEVDAIDNDIYYITFSADASPWKIVYLITRPSEAIPTQNSTLVHVGGNSYQLKVDNLNKEYIGQDVAVVFGSDPNYRYFVTDNLVTLRDVDIKAEKDRDDTGNGTLTVTISPNIDGKPSGFYVVGLDANGQPTYADNMAMTAIQGDNKTIYTYPLINMPDEGGIFEVVMYHSGLDVKKHVKVEKKSKPTPSVPTPEIITELEAQDDMDRTWRVVAPKNAPHALNGAVKLVVRRTDKGYRIALFDKNGKEVVSRGAVHVFRQIPEGMKIREVRVGNKITTFSFNEETNMIDFYMEI